MVNRFRSWPSSRSPTESIRTIAPAYLSQIETGKRDGTVATLKKLADALGIAVGDLVG